MTLYKKPLWALTIIFTAEVFATSALAQTPVAKIDSRDTAWMLVATALVLLMTIPGLALFYGGMVRKKNTLSILMQCFAICCLMGILWMIIGYSLAFDPGNAYVGGLIAAIMIGRRKGLRIESLAPHNLVLSVIGAALLWVGWFGFNAGSALAANGAAAMAMVVSPKSLRQLQP